MAYNGNRQATTAKKKSGTKLKRRDEETKGQSEREEKET